MFIYIYILYTQKLFLLVEQSHCYIMKPILFQLFTLLYVRLRKILKILKSLPGLPSHLQLFQLNTELLLQNYAMTPNQSNLISSVMTLLNATMLTTKCCVVPAV